MSNKEKLEKFLREHPSIGQFQPFCIDSPHALTIYFKSDADYSKVLGDIHIAKISDNEIKEEHIGKLVLMRSLETDEIIGLRIEKMIPHSEWLLKMADIEDSCKSVSVGGLTTDIGMT